MRSANIWCGLALAFFCLSEGTASSGADEATEVAGVLGESATFRLRTSEQFESIDWLKSDTNKDLSIFANLDPEGQCALKVKLPAFQGRLRASENCRELQVSDLRRDDSGRYTAQIQLVGGKVVLKETSELRVYKRLTEADVAILCHTTGNGTRWLNCSAGPWEDNVTVRWDDAGETEHRGTFAVMEVDAAKDPNVTCKAKNPVGEASRTVSVKETCEAEHPKARTTTAAPEDGTTNSSVARDAGIAICVLLLILLLAIFVGCWWKRKAAGRKHLDSAEAGNPCQTLYTEVGNISGDVGAPQPQPRRKHAKGKNDKIQTIYTTVNHAQTPPQTDDEKMRKGRGKREDPEVGEKTIYSEIANSQESEDQSLKTVYETVKNPQPPRGAEYNTII